MAWKNDIQNGGSHSWYSTFGTDGGNVWIGNHDMSLHTASQLEFEQDTNFLWNNGVLNTDGGNIWIGSVDITTPIQVNNWVQQQ